MASEFDSELTAAYRRAAELQVPLRYMALDAPVRLTDLIRENRHRPLLEIWDIVSSRGQLNPVEVSMVYYALQDRNPAMLDQINTFHTQLNTAAAEAPERGVSLRLPIFASPEALAAAYGDWDRRYRAQHLRDTQILEQINANQAQLATVEPVATTIPDIKTVTLRFTPRWRPSGRGVTVDDGIEILNEAYPSARIPQLVYMGAPETEPVIMIYTGVNNAQVFALFQEFQSKFTHSNTIHITFYHGPPGGETARINYTIARLSLITGTVEIECPLLDTTILPAELTTRLITERNRPLSELTPMEVAAREQRLPRGMRTSGVLDLGVQRVVLALAQTFPQLDFGLGEEVEVSGSFDVEDVPIDEMVFTFLIINEPLFGTYLYIDEKSKAQAEKTQFNILYRTREREREEDTSTSQYISIAASVRISFSEREIGFVSTLRNPRQVKFIAESEQVLEHFQRIFVRLLRGYLNELPRIQDYFNQLIPPSTEEDEEEDEEDQRTGARWSKIKALKRDAPEVFRNNQQKKYTRKCLCPLQPVLIPADEVAEWQQKVYYDTRKGQVLPRQVMPYPPPRTPGEVSKWFVVCPDDTNPMPSLKPNAPISANVDTFPFLPCCGQTDIIADPRSKYNNFYTTRPTERAPSAQTRDPRTGYRYLTGKFAHYGQTASIPPSLVDLLNMGMTTPTELEHEDFVRLGSVRSPSSLIHCLYQALQNETYLAQTTDEDREALVVAFRQDLVNRVNPLVCKQEAYDLSPEEIGRRLTDPLVFLDPYLYYRALEEAYNVNIFVFNRAGPIHPLEGIREGTGPEIQVPRAKFGHFRVPRPDRQTILILEHQGAEANEGSYPQCELIFSRGLTLRQQLEGTETEPTYGSVRTVTTAATYVFGPRMEQLMNQVTLQSMQPVIFSFEPKLGGPLPGTESGPAIHPVTRINPAMYMNWPQIFQNMGQLRSQHIDAFGKLRALRLALRSGSVITIFVTPSQPLNLPSFGIDAPPLLSEATIRQLFGEPSGITSEGLWFRLGDMDWAMFVPAQVSSSPTEQTPSGPRLSPHPPPPNPVTALRTVRRRAEVFMQLVEWVWRVSRLPFETWWQQYVYRGDVEAHPIGRIPRRLPVLPAGDTTGALRYIAEWWPQVFTLGSTVTQNRPGIVMYPALYDKAYAYFRRQAEITAGLSPDDPYIAPATYLSGIYTVDTDFAPKPQTQIFTRLEHFNNWIQYRLDEEHRVDSMNPILTTLDPVRYHQDGLEAGMLPYLYYDTTGVTIGPRKQSGTASEGGSFGTPGKIYLIQNVQGSDFNRAVNVGLKWSYFGQNAGPNAIPDPRTIPVFIYAVSKQNTIVPAEDRTGTSDTFIPILRYAENRYAAMLPLR